MDVREMAAAREVSPSGDDTLRMYSSRRVGPAAAGPGPQWPAISMQHNCQSLSLESLGETSFGSTSQPIDNVTLGCNGVTFWLVILKACPLTVQQMAMIVGHLQPQMSPQWFFWIGHVFTARESQLLASTQLSTGHSLDIR